MSTKPFIVEGITNEIETFEKQYSKAIFSNNKRIQDIIDHIRQTSGKKIRPLILLIAAKYFGDVNQVTYNSAITVELLHTATLIHDDVIDESVLRRGKPSCNAIFDNKSAVLAGDYYLSTSLVTSVMTGNFEIISTISQLGRTLAEGELDQMSLVREIIISEQEYYEVINKKTASLISACMKIGAISTNAPTEMAEKFADLGQKMGMIFQIRDDIFDYFKAPIGKPTGNDIREGKITLPLLYALENSPNKEDISKSLDIINRFDFNDENTKYLIEFAIDNGGIEYAYKVMQNYFNQSIDIINTLEENPAKKALIFVLDKFMKRDY